MNVGSAGLPSTSGRMRLSIGNSAFPAVDRAVHPRGPRVDFDGFDVVLNGNSAGLRTEGRRHTCAELGGRVTGLLEEQEWRPQTSSVCPGRTFTTMAPNHPDAGEA